MKAAIVTRERETTAVAGRRYLDSLTDYGFEGSSESPSSIIHNARVREREYCR